MSKEDIAEGHAHPAGGSHPDRTFCSKAVFKSYLVVTILLCPRVPRLVSEGHLLC